ncbi:MAG: AAA family ATPase [Deltaproteobacteria bacterium]|nr:AAA family ATPase [Deltaproteobacteria bacterium]
MGLVVAIANQKGGVGKTTTAVNLAASLAVAEQRVLLVDVDGQGNASSSLGLCRGRVQAGTYEVLLGQRGVEEVTFPTELSNLFIVPATPDLSAAELELAGLEDRAYRLRQAISPVRNDYDFIFIDCPPSLGLLTINALVAADEVIVPVQCEYLALEGLSALGDTIERVRRGLNTALRLDGVVLTMYDNRTSLSREVAEEVRKHFRVYETVIPRNVKLAEAPSHGKPIILYDATSKGSHAYLDLARELLSKAA